MAVCRISVPPESAWSRTAARPGPAPSSRRAASAGGRARRTRRARNRAPRPGRARRPGAPPAAQPDAPERDRSRNPRRRQSRLPEYQPASPPMRRWAAKARAGGTGRTSAGCRSGACPRGRPRSARSVPRRRPRPTSASGRTPRPRSRGPGDRLAHAARLRPGRPRGRPDSRTTWELRRLSTSFRRRGRRAASRGRARGSKGGASAAAPGSAGRFSRAARVLAHQSP